MKHLLRAALVALVSLTAAVAALLPVGPAMASTALPSAPPLIGTWANLNPNTQNIKDLVVSPAADGILVDAFSACTPTNCEWGNVPAIAFTQNNVPGLDPATDTAFRAEW